MQLKQKITWPLAKHKIILFGIKIEDDIEQRTNKYARQYDNQRFRWRSLRIDFSQYNFLITERKFPYKISHQREK